MSFFLINFYGTDVGIEEGNTRSYFQPIFLRQNAIFLQVFVYIYQYLSFKCQSCTPNLSLTKKLVKTLSLSSIFEGIIYSVFKKKASDLSGDGCWDSLCSDFIFVRCWNKIKNIPITEIERLLLFLWICQLKEYERMVIWFRNNKPAFKKHWIMVPMETESQIPS